MIVASQKPSLAYAEAWICKFPLEGASRGPADIFGHLVTTEAMLDKLNDAENPDADEQCILKKGLDDRGTEAIGLNESGHNNDCGVEEEDHFMY